MNIKPSRLYRLKDELPHEEFVAARVAGIEPGKTYWMEGSRPSSLGGFIGTFRDTYEHSLGVSPGSREFRNIPTRYMENFGLSTE